MTFDYEIVEDSHGEKIAIHFDYDERLVSKMRYLKSQHWHETHCMPYYENDEFQYWKIDRDAEAVQLFQQTFSVTMPPAIKPGEQTQVHETIELVVPEGYTWFFVQAPVPGDVDRYLYQELAYEVPGAEYSSEYKSGRWDGWNRLYSKDKHGAPRGLVGRASELIEELGYDVRVTIEGDRTGTDVDFGWEFPHELRNYQEDAVDAVLSNRGGIVSLPTGTGKTVAGMKMLQLEGQKSLVLVHTKELLYQWADEIRGALDVEPGLIGDGRWSEGDQVTVAIIQTLMSRGTDDLADDYGVLVFDECHRTSAADQMHQIGMDIDTDVRIGLSATPWRSTDGEELKIEGAIGSVAYEASAAEMIDDGFLARPEFESINPHEYGDYHTAGRNADYHDAYRTVVELQPARNRAVAERALELADDGYKVLVNVNRIKQGKLLEYALNGSVTGPDVVEEMSSRLDDREMREFASAVNELGHVGDGGAVFLHGSDDTERRQAVLERFENGDLDIVVSTLLKEGVDIPDINAIVLAQAGKSDIAQIQVIGRALRPANGEHAKIVDVADEGRYFEDQYDQRQAAMADYYGKYGPDSDWEPEERDEPVSLTEPMSEEEEEELFEDLFEE